MLRINQNIPAMQGKYYLEMNETSFNKSIERLSSGLRINKAADDPAGLVISEKYRAQVEGLQQAITNAKDGIGMIQTSEGAIDEMTKLLKSMRTLALAAANTSVNDTTSLQTDQDQINSMIQSFDRIVDRTKFGSKNLLDGSLGLTATTGSSSLEFVEGTNATQAGKYNVSINSAASLGYVQSAAYVKAAVSQTAGATTLGGITADTSGLAFTGDVFTAKFGSNGYRVSISAGGTGTLSMGQVYTQLAADTTLSTMGISVTLTAGHDRFVFTSTKYAGQISIGSIGAGNVSMAQGIAASLTTGGVGGTVTLSSAELGSFKLASAETLTFQDVSSGLAKQVTVAADTYLNAITSTLNTQFSTLGVNMTTTFETSTNVAGGQSLRFTNTAYGDSTAVKLTIGHNISGTAGLSLAFATGTQVNVADGGSVSSGYGSSGANVSGFIDGIAATGSGRNLTSASGNSAGLKLLYTGTTSMTSTAVTVNGSGGLVFQVGAFQNQTVTTQINDLRSSRMGLNAAGSGSTKSVYNIDVRSATGAQEALAVIDDALSNINAVRGKLGSFQKDVLESTVRNLGVAKQNLASSESNIRDADMAEEMLSFSRAQILQQTGMAMLAQANQATNQIMGLFR